MSTGTLAFTKRDADGPLTHITDSTYHSTNGFSFNSDLNLHSGKVFKINNAEVLSANTLGSSVTGSGLTTVGTLTTLKMGGVLNLDSNNITNGGTITAGSFVGNLTGGASSATTCTTAALLATARNIGGVSFNGSADINLPGVNVAGNQDTTGNAGTVTGGVYITGSQTITGAKTFNTAIVGDITGNASTATVLQTARTIGGVSFDGSANVVLPGVNAVGNQNTTGNAATATTVTGAAQSAITSVGNLTGLNINGAFSFPTSDGSANQVIKTDGSGNLSWAAASSGNGVVAGILAIDSEQGSAPSIPANGSGGKLYTKADGKLYWVSYDVSETAVSDGGGGGGGGSASLWYEPFGMLTNSGFGETETVATTKQVSYYHGFMLKTGGTYNKIRIRTRAVGGSGTATVNVAVYSSNGNTSAPQPNGKLVSASQSSVSASNDILSVTIADTVLSGGTLYYLALMWDSASATCGFYGTGSIGNSADHKMMWKQTGTTSFPSTAGGSVTNDSAFWFVLSGAEGSVTTLDVAAGSANSNHYLTFVGGATGAQSFKTDSNFVFNPSTDTLSVPNLTVSGTTTQVNSTTVTIADPILQLGSNASDDNLDRGLVLLYNDGSARKAFMGYDDSDGKFTMLTDATDTSNVFSGTKATLKANIEGTVSDTSNITSLGTLTSLSVQGNTGLDVLDTGNSTPVLRVRPWNQRIGINVVVPEFTLHLNGPTGTPERHTIGFGGEYASGHAGDKRAYIKYFTGDGSLTGRLYLGHTSGTGVNGQWGMSITSHTNCVGINTATPTSACSIFGDFGVTANGNAANTTHTKGLYMRYNVHSGADTGIIQSVDRSTSSPTYHPLAFNASKYNFNDGNVGIGTTSPTGNLHVYQTTKAALTVSGAANIVLDCEDLSTQHYSHGSGISFRQRWWNGNMTQVATGAIHSYKDYGSGGFGGGLRFYYGSAGSSNLSLAMYYGYSGHVYFSIGHSNASDDRLKENEEYITGATNTLKKLKPQIYDKHTEMEPRSEDSRIYKESGLIAQEVYYDAPELRHLVTVGGDATPADSIPTSSDPTTDPDYSSWGTEIASFNYVGLIPYLVKSVTELSAELDAERAKTAALEAKMATVLAHLNLDP